MPAEGVQRLLLLGAVLAAPSALAGQLPHTLRWGPQRPDLMRFNRVEGLSVGARGQIRPQTLLGPLSVTGTARVGIADLEPNGRIDITRETVERRITVSVFHELAAIDQSARHLGLANSLLAAFLGRDDGDYFRRSGAWLEWTPPEAERRDLRVRGFGEYHRAARAETDFALIRLGSDSFQYRENIVADQGWVYGALIELTPTWGSDPNLVQGGLELTAEAATGDFEYARAAATARLAVPLPSDLRLGLEVGAGTGWGVATAQRSWYLGGPSSLRGYDPRRLTGTSYGRATGELAHTFSFGAVSLFTDVGWAGEYQTYTLDDALYSAGVGLSVLDGLIRLDSAWGLRRPRAFRFDLYLDQVS